MRTTVTLESDVQALIRKAMQERRVSFKEALNSAVRAGLARQVIRPFAQQTFSLGHARSFRLDKALGAAAAMEDEEIARKLSLRK